MTPTREVLLHFSYVFGFSRRKGWYMKPYFERILLVDCDAPFRLNVVRISFQTGHRTQVRQFCKSYHIGVDGLETGLPLAAFGATIPCNAEFKPGQAVKISFKGQPFGKMRKTMRWHILFSGYKVFKVPEPSRSQTA